MSKLLTALIASCGIAFASAAGAQAMTKQAYEAQNDKVDAMYKADKERCDTLAGNASANTISGGSGADTAFGGPLDDVIDGGSGGDTLWGNFGSDDISGGSGADRI